jgi:uncharacterized membrane protein YdjX (TVP38/TMEM64 family)
VAESLLRQPIGKSTRGWVLGGTCAAVSATLLALQTPGAGRMVVFVLLTLWCHGPLSPLLPAAYEPVLLAYGSLFSPLLVATIGAVSSTAVEYVNYHLYRKLLQYQAFERILRSDSSRSVMALFFRCPFLAVWLCICSPLPDWAARILASHSGYPVRRYLAAVLLARLPRFWFLAALGLHLKLGIGTMFAIALGSVILTFGLRWCSAGARKVPHISPSEAAMRTALLLLLGLAQVGMMAPTARLIAQEPSPRLLRGVAQGATFDRFLYDGSGITAFSFRLSDLKPGHLRPELGVSLFPEALPARALILAPDFGAAYNISLPLATLLVKAGGSAIAGLASDLVFVPGFHVGAGLVARIDSRTGIRVDVIRHTYLAIGETEPIWSVGLGFTSLPRLRH